MACPGRRSEPAMSGRKLFEAARLVEHGVEQGFEANTIHPMEFGGDMGTVAVTDAVIAAMKRFARLS